MEAINAFNQCKNQLANVTLLAHPSQDDDLALKTDASSRCSISPPPFGPLPPSQGFSYCLTAIDRFSRLPETYPTSDMTVVATVIREWIPRFGVPGLITTDQGPQFESHLSRELCACLGISKIRTTPYHPSSNGLVERTHRSLKLFSLAYAMSLKSTLMLLCC
ncbi:pro-Pol polyprotein [Trichonephila inaurata madagascariensis]|uniref:Pro-Pol polyprotein n=1 Tax=Trichonephila inaurata madagascariensis TaxID=2747483 RepID=A0A8X6XTU0_9ARAC|nr:pro-Pol polyprotein [Trichonephila inaurata madagascariensis]